MSKEHKPRRTGGGLLVAILASFLALVALLAYSLERTAWLFTQFEQQQELAYAAAVVVELAAVALIAGSGAIGHLDQTARAWANRALIAVLSTQALANLSAGYLRGGRALLLLLDPEGGGAAYAVAAALWLVINLSVPALVLCLSKLLERLLAARATTAQQTADAAQLQPLLDAATADLAQARAQAAQLADTARAESARLEHEAAALRSERDAALAESAESTDQLRTELDALRTTVDREQAELTRLRAESARTRELQAELEDWRDQANDMMRSTGLDVRSIAQQLRDRGLPLRTIGDVLGVSEKTIRNWTMDVRTNGHKVTT